MPALLHLAWSSVVVAGVKESRSVSISSSSSTCSTDSASVRPSSGSMNFWAATACAPQRPARSQAGLEPHDWLGDMQGRSDCPYKECIGKRRVSGDPTPASSVLDSLPHPVTFSRGVSAHTPRLSYRRRHSSHHDSQPSEYNSSTTEQPEKNRRRRRMADSQSRKQYRPAPTRRKSTDRPVLSLANGFPTIQRAPTAEVEERLSLRRSLLMAISRDWVPGPSEHH
jgi:hypothetical protein